GVFFYLIAFDSACSLYGSPEQKEFFSKRGLSRIRVRDDGKCFPPVDFFLKFHNGGKGTGFGVWCLGFVVVNHNYLTGFRFSWDLRGVTHFRARINNSPIYSAC
ncbi:MAG: hypothetical protein JWQ30_1647, partial [Sediminibacterium sp.]|nr:hypothetical protein [Sediminibacterium sp.]